VDQLLVIVCWCVFLQQHVEAFHLTHQSSHYDLNIVLKGKKDGLIAQNRARKFPKTNSLFEAVAITSCIRPKNALLQLSKFDEGGYSDWNSIAILVATVGQGSFVVLAYFLGNFLKIPLADQFTFSNSTLLYGVLGAAPLLLLNFSLKYFFGESSWFLEIEKLTQDTCKNLFGLENNALKLVIGALMLAVAAGSGEEMLFRGVLQRSISDIGGNFVGLGVASIIFGVLHFLTPAYALIATASGFYFGWLYLFSGNLLVPILAHSFYDFIALIYNAQMARNFYK